MKHVAVMGYGTVGSGVYEVLTKNKEVVSKNVGEELNVKYVLDLREFPGDPVENVLTHNFDDILNDEEVCVVAEVMGGIEPAYTFTKKCLLAGKSVSSFSCSLVKINIYCTPKCRIVASFFCILGFFLRFGIDPF